MGLAGRPAPAAGGRAPRRGGDGLAELGVRPIINAAGTYTKFGGMLPRPEVVDAMAAAAGRYARLEEVHGAAGARIAALLECEAALVTSGAAGALTLATAACLTGNDPERIRRLPDLGEPPREVVIQRAHRFLYDHAVRACGVRLVEVDTREELEHAITARTAMLLFLNKAAPDGRISAPEFAAAGRRRGVPTLNDAAADVPPVDTLFRYTRMGFDLVVCSGGKGLGGPQGAGLLLGRRDLVAAARLNTAPHSDTLGRGLKVSKEEAVGMVVAVDLYLRRDHDADWRAWEAALGTVESALEPLPHVRAERFVPAVAYHVPHLRVRPRGGFLGTMAEVAAELREGEPAIETVPTPLDGTLEIASWTLQPGEPEVVARRLREILVRRGGGAGR